jgi:hypothetical protein
MNEDALAMLDEDTRITRVETSAIATISRSEIEAQLDAAHRYPRSVKKFLQDATGLATLTQDVAESCIYALPRGQKTISGPSVRLAEIVASSWGNIHAASRVLDADDTEITSQGVAWDLEKNYRVTVEVRRRITNKKGQRYDDDMITVTGNAAGSISFRNAVFRNVPRAYVNLLYSRVRSVAVGNAQTLVTRRLEMIERLTKLGVHPARVFARLGKVAVEDIGLDDLEILVGLGTAIKSGDRSIDDCFPAVADPSKSKGLEEEIANSPPPEKRSRKSAAAATPPAEAKTPAHDPQTGELPLDGPPPGVKLAMDDTPNGAA